MLTVTDARDAQSLNLVSGIAQAWYDQKDHVPEGVWVSCMNAIGEIRTRLEGKGRSWEETMNWFHVHHPVSILSAEEFGDEVTSSPNASVEISVNNQERRVTEDEEEYPVMLERLKLDMIATGRWIMWIKGELRNMKEIKRMSKAHKTRAIRYIRTKEGIPEPVHAYSELQSRVAYLSRVSEKEFFSKYKESHNHNITRRKFRAENFLKLLENHQSQLQKIIFR